MLEFHIAAISCDHCVRTVTEAVRQIDRHAKVQVDSATKTVRVESNADRKALVGALAGAGYPPA